MNDFYMTLLSDSSMNMFPHNKQSELTVKLDHPILIEEESWEVALVEISTPSEVLNITEINNFFFLSFPDQHSLYTNFGVENITDMCSNDDNDCYKFKLMGWAAFLLWHSLGIPLFFLYFQLEITCHLNIWLKKSRPQLTDLEKVYWNTLMHT